MKQNKKWSKIALAALTLTAVIGTAGILYASGGAAGADNSMTGPHGALSPAKLKDLGWRVMNFVALAIILVKFLKNPLVDALKGRKQTIAAEFEDLEARRSDAEREYKEYESKLAGIDDELKQMVETAIAQGQKGEIADAKRSLKAEITEQATIMAEEIIKKNLQAADQDKLVEDYLTKVGGLK